MSVLDWVDFIMLATYIVYQVCFFIFPLRTILHHELPTASAVVVVSEQVRLLWLSDIHWACDCYIQGSCWSLKVLEFFFQIFKAWKVLETDMVLESPWIWFSKTPWPNQLILKKVLQRAYFWPQLCIKSIFASFAPDPTGGSLRRLYMLIKVSVWFNLVLLIYPLCCPWKSLKSPWIWFWQMGENPVYKTHDTHGLVLVRVLRKSDICFIWYQILA